MTAHNRSIGFGLNDRACAVIDRAYRASNASIWRQLPQIPGLSP